MSAYAPRIITIKVNSEKIRDIIGKGGATIRKIQEDTGTEINVDAASPGQDACLVSIQTSGTGAARRGTGGPSPFCAAIAGPGR
jgi:polyribonucleotide nucleotidyltransferase